MIGSYAGWLTNSLRRRRSVLFGLVLGALLLVVCVQYNASGNDATVQNALVTSGTSDGAATDESGQQQQQNDRQQSMPRIDDNTATAGGGGGAHVDFINAPQPQSPPSDRTSRRTQYMHIAEQQEQRRQRQQSAATAATYVPPGRLVHIDFKGAPPRLPYLQKLFPLIRRFGGTGLLLEWEDMFPWTGPLASLAAGNAYTRTDVRDILAAATANRLDVMPLIQTFGHVEFALKLPEFSQLREVQESPQALCPSNNASVKFVEQMIDQVSMPAAVTIRT